MNKNIEILLSKLEPEIDSKCKEIKLKRIKKVKDIIFIISLILLTILPSILYLLNISLIYYISLIIIISSLRLFIKLPDILKKDLKGVCYE